uniref:Uncharacterized protein n=1 Tax=Cucumis melo TaxID=3656 RepID=A0A9I9E6J1_CUCME
MTATQYKELGCYIRWQYVKYPNPISLLGQSSKEKSEKRFRVGEKFGLYHIRCNGKALDLRRNGNGKWNHDLINEGYPIALFHHYVYLEEQVLKFKLDVDILQAAVDTKIVRSANVSAKIKQSRFSRNESYLSASHLQHRQNQFLVTSVKLSTVVDCFSLLPPSSASFSIHSGGDLQTYAYVLLGPFESYAYARCEYFVGSFELIMKVRGTIHGEKVVVLIDCGATHNYGVILDYGAAVKGKGVGRS